MVDGAEGERIIRGTVGPAGPGPDVAGPVEPKENAGPVGPAEGAAGARRGLRTVLEVLPVSRTSNRHVGQRTDRFRSQLSIHER